jgi:hypothetical protein
MDVTCKNGRHFNDLIAAKECARQHPGGCGECEGITRFTSQGETPPAKNEVNKQEDNIRPSSNAELTKQKKTSRKNEETVENRCPLKKPQEECPCPRCCHSESISERKEFFNTTTFWICKYPHIIKLSVLQPEDIIREEKDT